ncbi:fibronectin type III domain-containing protein [Butyrivibrio sp. AD3002]|uniref:fibronectin type III domain-containing protein n=1 Tax=Butyrivibrio sp. AD3002 TaxID=1280670 RepID=UPI0003B3B262|nr:fibronectin type III domain-containing protein [Butyrivibrio sp. AD3002]
MKQVIRKIGCSLLAFALTFMTMSGIMEAGIVKAQETVTSATNVILTDGTVNSNSSHSGQFYDGTGDAVLFMANGTTYDSITLTATNTLTIKNLNTPKLTGGSKSNVSFWGSDFTFVFEGTNYIQDLSVDGNSTIKMAAGASLKCDSLGIDTTLRDTNLTLGDGTTATKDPNTAKGSSISDIEFTNTQSQPEPQKVNRTITFDANGGTGTMDAVTVTEGSQYTLPENKFTPPTDKEFDKWDKGAAGAVITITEDTTIKALWKDKADGAAGDKADEKIDKSQKNAKLSKPKAGKKSITIKWKKQTAKGIKGYEIQYSTDKDFKTNVKKVTITKAKTETKTIKKLKSGKKYYVRIRTYKKVSGEKVYSNWSTPKSVKVK